MTTSVRRPAIPMEPVTDPAAWRYWDGTAYAGVWTDPYTDPASIDGDTCAPFAHGALSGGVQEGIVYDEASGNFVMVGVTFHPSAPEPRWGVYVSSSPDLVEWSTRRLVLSVPVSASIADIATDTLFAYPSLIDPDSSSPNFETTDGSLYLYMSRFNFGGGSLDRDLLRWPIEITEVELPAPEWTFDTDGDAEGWVADNGLTSFEVVEGALATTTKNSDPWMLAPDVTIPERFDRFELRMRVPSGVSTVAQLFWSTSTSDPGFSESRTVTFVITGTGEYQDDAVDLSDHPGWSGTVTGLRFDPIESSDRAIAIDRIAFTDR